VKTGKMFIFGVDAGRVLLGDDCIHILAAARVKGRG
jgi:hypothetical protein